jgi:hypothetical protein
MINALNSRLGRIVDRRRVVLERLPTRTGGCQSEESTPAEIRKLERRSRLVYYAIFCAVLSALLVCLVVAGAFLGALLGVDLARSVAALFIAAMLAMIAALGLFLREVLPGRAFGERTTLALSLEPDAPPDRHRWPSARSCMAQGKRHVRRTVPERCPNPPDLVKAESPAAAPPCACSIVGDSAAAGVGAADPGRGPERAARRVAGADFSRTLEIAGLHRRHHQPTCSITCGGKPPTRLSTRCVTSLGVNDVTGQPLACHLAPAAARNSSPC